jgi:hypothetical protein
MYRSPSLGSGQRARGWAHASCSLKYLIKKDEACITQKINLSRVARKLRRQHLKQRVLQAY